MKQNKTNRINSKCDNVYFIEFVNIQKSRLCETKYITSKHTVNIANDAKTPIISMRYPIFDAALKYEFSS